MTAHRQTDQTPRQLALHTMSTPVGVIQFATNENDTLFALTFEEQSENILRLISRQFGGSQLVPTDGVGPVGDSLQRYFDGDLVALSGIRTVSAGTPFQREVWAALIRIPIGTTTSYGAIAASIGRPKAVRAVGMANGANPIGVVVPCHRVIGTDGTMTGYGGGIERKRWLLAHEGVVVPRTLDLVNSGFQLG